MRSPPSLNCLPSHANPRAVPTAASRTTSFRPDGNLYGTTAGPAGGTIFKLTEAGQITVLHTFTTNPTTRY
jgi:uncharacterized repeat protein (TIGR03803 family)